MKVIICLDDNNGMLFNHRRQSRDKKIIEDIYAYTNELWIAPFSQKIFELVDIKLTVSDMFLIDATSESYCFVEDKNLKPYEDRIEQLIVYKWNRKYPSDFKCDLCLKNWTLMESIDFVGNSHDKITKEIYTK